MNLGKRIYNFRKDRNMTQEQLALEMKVSITAVSKWENNCSSPDLLTLCSLADYFDTTTDFLLGLKPRRYKAIVAEPAGIPRDVITRILVENNCNVVAKVSTLEDLVVKLKRQKIDFITIEADMDNSEDLFTLKSIHTKYPDTRIFVFSNNSDSKRIQQAKSIGVSQYYTKPFSERCVTLCIESMNT